MGLTDWLVRRVSRACVQMMGGGLAGNFRQDAYANAVVRETVDAIARHAAKLTAVHMRGGERVDDRIQYIIGTRPNPHMSAYDFQYKLFSAALLQNNGFALPVWTTRGELRAIVPVDYTSAEVLADEKNGDIYMRFVLTSGNETLLPYADLVHIRRHFAKSTLLGDANAPLDDAVEMVNVANAGMMSAIRSGSNLRGILKLKQAQLKDRDVRQRRDDFVREYMENGQGGIAGLDASMDYVQLDPSKMYNLTPEQMKAVRGNIQRNFGVNEGFVSGEYDEKDWDAIYEAIIEPFAIQLHMEYTNALFTAQQHMQGENIAVSANRLQYASVTTKTDLVNRLGMLGLITVDEGREVFNLPPIPGGNKLLTPWNAEAKSALNEREVQNA